MTSPVALAALPNGFWFGTQDLLCVVGVEKDDLLGLLPDFIASRLTKRSAPRRTTLNPNHRMVFYRGHVYEWGTGWVSARGREWVSERAREGVGE